MPQPCKTIFVTGGIVSGIGKGITTASIGRILIDLGYQVFAMKADPYLNEDAGTMNPFQHGEVFVTDDGAEADLDLGHYERFLDVNLNKYSIFTSGSVLRHLMDQEREGEFLGKTIQFIPHVTNEIKNRYRAGKEQSNPEFLLIEIGGTLGDMEALPHIEAARQYKFEEKDNTIFVHVVKMDYLYPSDESKTKPIQHSVTNVRSYGVNPDILIVRCKRPLNQTDKEKLTMYTGIPVSHIISACDSPSLYKIPALLEKDGLADAIMSSFRLPPPAQVKSIWEPMYKKMEARQKTVRVGLVGKYMELGDAYLSVIEAIQHAGIYHSGFTEIIPINSEVDDIANQMQEIDALIVPGGFGARGVEGKIEAIHLARSKKIPFLGICLGLQTAVIEIARHEAGMSEATSTEFDEKTAQPVIAILPDQLHIKKKGGTMRLGSYPAQLKPGSLVEKVYQTYRPEELKDGTVTERHRHRYEVNPEFHQALEKTGLLFSGLSPDHSLVEFIELPTETHPYFIATQAHPELRSRPHRPHPLFAGLIAAVLQK